MGDCLGWDAVRAPPEVFAARRQQEVKDAQEVTHGFFGKRSLSVRPKLQGQSLTGSFHQNCAIEILVYNSPCTLHETLDPNNNMSMSIKDPSHVGLPESAQYKR
eukprot:4777966-Amphidinium_carterae.2